MLFWMFLCILVHISQTTGAVRLKLGQRMHLLSLNIDMQNKTLKLNVNAFITLHTNIVFNGYPTVYGVQVYNAPQMCELDLLLLWTVHLHPGTRSVPTNFNQT